MYIHIYTHIYIYIYVHIHASAGALEKQHPSIAGARFVSPGEIDLKAKIAAMRQSAPSLSIVQRNNTEYNRQGANSEHDVVPGILLYSEI